MSDHSIETVEVWKDIPGYKGHYQVSNLGRVRSLARHVDRIGNRKHTRIHLRFYRERILRQGTFGKGYKSVILCRDKRKQRFSVHTLVLLAFVGPCPENMECCHFPDRNRGNNHLENLSWGTKKKNQADRAIHGTDLKGEKHPMAILNKDIVLAMRRLHETGMYTYVRLGKMFKVSEGTASNAVRGLTWSHI